MSSLPTIRAALRPLLQSSRRLPAAARLLSTFPALRKPSSADAIDATPSSIETMTVTTPSGSAVSYRTPENIDWSTSYFGLSTEPFSKEITDILTRTVDPKLDVEMKPDGIIYMPEVRYRKVLNEAFGPGGWGLVPRGDTVVGDKIVTREYALIVHGRFISQAQGENNFFSVDQIPRAVEGCKSNALMRCCKDLGIAWQLWDPAFIRRYQSTQAEQVWVEHVVSKKKARIWIKKGDPVPYPYKKSA
ncbi:hypothetical protein TD95_004098 [Thielaviopsis punctulata]|uniref:Mitochondrial genome maintenance protein MGM101 n=1 Tax=Thielaviopsis punctulata TaxID=72032 RepID=A0A0F4ZAF2_9PEZI|nr:hypothetical protein TD95_004098 [Thielaviopsis punctulata]